MVYQSAQIGGGGDSNGKQPKLESNFTKKYRLNIWWGEDNSNSIMCKGDK